VEKSIFPPDTIETVFVPENLGFMPAATATAPALSEIKDKFLLRT